MRSASNPGGLGHEWVRARFVDRDRDAECVFIPARLDDNPHLDQEGYRATASSASIRSPAPNCSKGTGRYAPRGPCFAVSGSRSSRQAPEAMPSRVRYWDKAATEGGGARSAGVLIATHGRGLYYVEDVVCGPVVGPQA